MDSSDRILRILLKLTADTADEGKVKQSLKNIEDQAKKTGNAANDAADSTKEIFSSGERLSGTFLIAGTAALAVYNHISNAADQMVRFATETKKESDELFKQEERWVALAKAAEDFGDVVKLSEKAGPELAQLHAKLDQFRTTELGYFAQFFDKITSGWAALGQMGPRFNADPLTKAISDLQTQIHDKFLRINADIDAAQNNASAFQEAKVGIIADAVGKWTEKLNAANKELASINRNESEANLNLWVKKAADVKLYSDQLEQLRKIQEQDKEEEEKIADEVLREQAADEAEKHREKEEAVNVALREQSSLIQNIHQQQSLIEGNSFLSPDAKQALTLASMSAEILQIGAALAQTKQQLKDSALDPEIHERLQAQLQKDQYQFDLLQLKIAKINKPLSGELADWVNSFGTAAHQIGNTIEGTINAALQGTNQLLIDAAFQTGDWHQTLVGVERQILNLFLTWLEQMALQKGAQLLGITTTTAAQAASGATIAAAHAPAAAATSISSYGASAVIGEILAVAAIAAIIAALAGGFKKGGYTGDGSPDSIAGVVHGGEFVFPAGATSNIGVSNLTRLMHYADGGEVPPWEPPPPLPGTYPPPIGNWPPSLQINPGDNPYNPYNPYGMPENYNPNAWPYHDSVSGGPYFPPVIVTHDGGDGVYGDATGSATYHGRDMNGEPIYGDAQGHLYHQDGTPFDGGHLDGIGGGPGRPPFYNPATQYVDTTGHVRALHDAYSDPHRIADALGGDELGGAHTNFTGSTGDQGHDIFNLSPGGGFRGRMIDGTLVHVFAPGGPIHRAYDPGVQSTAQIHQQVLAAFHHAAGGVIPGAPSAKDNVLSWLATGEGVISVAGMQRGRALLGPNFLDQLNAKHFADGGVAGGGGSGSAMQRSGAGGIVILNFTDKEKLVREYMARPEMTKLIVDTINGRRHELGLGGVE